MSYKGDGKYNSSTFIAFHDLPDSKEIATEGELKRINPPGQGWWPVIALKTVVEGGKTWVLLVCWYQLLSDGQIVAWWICVDDDDDAS